MRTTQMHGQSAKKWSIWQVIRVLVLVFLVLGMAGGMYVVFGRWLVISQIRCFVVDQEIDQASCLPQSKLRGKSLLFTRLDEPEVLGELQTVIAPDKLIYFTHFRKQLPDTLLLYYAISEPVYTISFDQEQWYVVNENGQLKLVSEKPSLPEVFWSQSFVSFDITNGVIPPKSHHWLLRWLAAAKQGNRPISYIGLDSTEQISVIFTDTRRALLTTDSDPQVELERLRLIEQEILANPRTNQKKVVEIDLRFRFPVIREK